jgi:hypothetical protein
VATSDAPSIGTKLGPDGNVAEMKGSFAVNEPIWLTFSVRETASDLQVTITILDSNRNEIKSLFTSMAGETSATVPIRNLEPGRYIAEGYVNDDQKWEVSFEIR